jgi:hypothetical protein
MNMQLVQGSANVITLVQKLQSPQQQQQQQKHYITQHKVHAGGLAENPQQQPAIIACMPKDHCTQFHSLPAL